jgi:hypothetical protein
MGTHVRRSGPALILPVLLVAGLAQPAVASRPPAKGLVGAALAHQWVKATTTAQRVAVLDQALKALDIAVMDPNTGRFTLAGTASAQAQGYLYSNEVTGLALAAAGRHTVPLTTVAAMIAGSGYADAHLSLTADSLGAALVAGAKTVAKHTPAGGSGLAAVAAIGKLEHRALTAAPTALDPLQALLVVEDFTQPELAHLPVGATGTQVDALTGDLLSRAKARKKSCAKDTPAKGTAPADLGALAAGWAARDAKSMTHKGTSASAVAASIAAAVKAADKSKAAEKLRDAQHGVSIEAEADIDATAPAMPIALGSAPVDFTAKVTIDVTMHNNVVVCGELKTIDFHAQGPVPGVRIAWDTASLADWGALSPAVPVTGKNGIATMTFSPYGDLSTGGQQLTATGTASAAIKLAGAKVDLDKPLPWTITFHDEVDLAYVATVSYTDDCNNPGPCNGNLSDSLLENSSLDAQLSGTATVPLSLGTTQSTEGVTTEKLDDYTYDDTWNNPEPAPGCKGDDHEVGVGTQPGPFHVTGLTVSSGGSVAGNPVSSVGLSYSFSFLTDPVLEQVPGETYRPEESVTVSSDNSCTGPTTVTGTEEQASSTVDWVHYQAGDEYTPEGADGIITLPAHVWSISPSWTPATGGMLATAKVDESASANYANGNDEDAGFAAHPLDGESHGDVTETITLSTPKPGPH